MTAEAFAGLFQARRTGAGKWQARCPAHADRLPSLSIREGLDDRILLHCLAGCTIAVSLDVLRLARREHHVGLSPLPELSGSLRAERKPQNAPRT
jgi:hypothetical protein